MDQRCLFHLFQRQMSLDNFEVPWGSPFSLALMEYPVVPERDVRLESLAPLGLGPQCHALALCATKLDQLNNIDINMYIYIFIEGFLEEG